MKRSENQAFNNIPDELKKEKRWVVWKVEQRDEKPTKVPYTPGVLNPHTLKRADSTDPETWRSFNDAKACYDGNDTVAGLGFVLGDGYCGIDIDGRELDDPFIIETVGRFSSYTDISPSGNGIHIIIKGKKPGDRCKEPNKHVEIYDADRYFTMTGNLYGESHNSVESRQDALTAFYYEIFPPTQQTTQTARPSREVTKDDVDLLEKARQASNGAKFIKLFDNGDGSDYESLSEADLALCSMLAFWTQGDIGRIDSLFRQSALYRDKWDREDYRDKTIAKALEKSAMYDPNYKSSNRESKNDSKQSSKSSKNSDDEEPTAQENKKPTDTSWITSIEYTDGWRAKYLCAVHGEDIRWVDEWGKWLVWDGKRFEIDRRRRIERLAKRTVAEMLREAARRVERGDNAKELIEQAKKADNKSKYTAMIDLAKSEPNIPIIADEIDVDPMLFNVENGTVDLRSGDLTPHNRNNLITKLAPVTYDPSAKSPRWTDFLNRIMDNDAELIQFLQRAVGYSLTGEIREQVLLIMYGTGANGKTTFIECIKGLMGDYARDCEPDLLVQRKHEQHPAGLADLMGARFVSTTEIGEGVRLNEALLKRLTGGDTIKARFMRQDWFEFNPTHTLWCGVNHKPGIKGTDTGIWRRVRLIPFEVTIHASEQIPLTQMLKVFQSERSGILNWAIEGCLQWQEDGLGLPAKIHEATETYRSEMDVAGRFIDECCVTGYGFTARSAQIYKAFCDWCEANGEYPRSNKWFSQQLIEKGFDKDRDAQSVFFHRIGVEA